MRKRLLVLLTATLVMVSLEPIANAAVKPGTTCKKAGQISTSAGIKYTCIKSGKKLIWNKGVAVKKPAPVATPTPTPSPTTPTAIGDPIGAIGGTPSPSPSPTATPTPTPTPEVQLPTDGSLCTKIGEKVINSTGAMRCSWDGHANSTEEAIQKLRWRSFQITKVSTSKSNSYPSTPVDGAACASSGDTFDVSGGILECRWTAGKKLKWIKINTVKNTFTNAKSPVSLETCKLQLSDSKADRTGGNAGAGIVGFPFELIKNRKPDMYVKGTNEVLVIPVDFPDFPGGPGVLEQLEYDKKWLNNWYDYFSNGQSKFNVTTINRWYRMPQNRSGYPTNAKNIDAYASDANMRQGKQAQTFIDEITKEIDLRKFSSVYLFYPDGEYALGDLIVRSHLFKIKEGETHLNFFSWGRNLEGMETLKWSYYIHETLHDFNIIGHAPGNGWPLGMMTNQSGISYAMNPWEQFVLDWLPADQIYCDEASNLRPVTLSLSPLEREDKQTKMAVIKLSPTKAIVVESHGIDKWSNFKFGDREFSPGFYSVMAYVVDLDKASRPPGNADSSSSSNDDWAWAVWQKVNGVSSSGFNKSIGDGKNLADYVAVLGDSFVIEGVRIKFVGTGDYETIEISKA